MVSGLVGTWNVDFTNMLNPLKESTCVITTEGRISCTGDGDDFKNRKDSFLDMSDYQHAFPTDKGRQTYFWEPGCLSLSETGMPE